MRRPALLYYRYALFGLLVVANAIICSAAVWNLTLAVDKGSKTRIDSYMTFLGAFSLVLVFPLIFLDVFARLAITGRVWAECLWAGFLLALHLPGAIAVSAILPGDMCTLTDPQTAVDDACTSTRVLQAFAWICTLNLLLYLSLLIAAAILHGMQDDTVWHASVRAYPWFAALPCQIKSRPQTPTSPRFNTDTFVAVAVPAPALALAAPQPRRPPAPLPPPAPPSALEERYQIEHLSDDVASGQQSLREAPAAHPRYAPSRAAPGRAPGATIPSLYPLQIQAALETQKASAPAPAPAPLSSPHDRADAHDQAYTPTPPSAAKAFLNPSPRPRPPDRETKPLGDWPRPDIMQMQKPPRKPRRPPPGPLRLASFVPDRARGAQEREQELAPVRPAAARHESEPVFPTAASASASASATAPSAFPSSSALGNRPRGPRHRTQSSTDTTRARPSLEMMPAGVGV